MRLTKDEPAENQTVIVISNQNFPVNAMTGEMDDRKSFLICLVVSRKMLNDVSSISIIKPKKTGPDLAEEDKRKAELPIGIL